jgi:5'-3' exonuclease
MLHDSPAKAKTVLVIDSSNLLYRGLYANKDLKTTTGLPSGHIYGAIRMLLAAFRDMSDDICPIFCYDGSNAKAKRQETLPTYKGNRTVHEFCPIDTGKELLKLLPGLHIEKEGLEGDDSLAWAVELVKPKATIVYSGDKDLIALMRYPNVKVYSPNKKRIVEKADWLEEYHVEDPAKIYMAKSLFGDASDNIKGVERLIKKQVEPILNDEKCVDLAAFYDMIAEKPDSMTEKMWRRTLDAKEQVLINYNVILPRISTFDKTAVTRTIKNEENCKKLLNVLKKYECVSTFFEAEALYK